jgi:hypothetical protein
METLVMSVTRILNIAGIIVGARTRRFSYAYYFYAHREHNKHIESER